MANTTVESIMRDFHARLGSEKLCWMMSQFNGSKTTEEMYTFIWDFEEAHKCLNPSLISSGKSQEETEKYIFAGDRHYKEKCLSKALEQYNFAVMHAPHPDVTMTCLDKERCSSKTEVKAGKPGDFNLLATSYAKRSSVLLDLEQTEEGLNDINLALAHGYPDVLGKLENCKNECLISHNGTEGNGNLIEDFKSSLKISSSREHQNVPKVQDPHPSLSSLTKGVKVAYSEDKGRHVIAERDIYPGEIIGVEKSTVSCLEVANLPSYCSACYKYCLAPLPCPECSMVVFCSEACRKEGLTGDHWLECCILPTMVEIGLQPVFSISLKLLKRYTCAQWRAHVQKQHSFPNDYTPADRQPGEKGPSIQNDFESIHHLVSNKDTRPNGDLYVKCVIAFLLTKLLLQSGRFFTESCEVPRCPTRDDLLFTGQLLFTHLLKVSCNGFTQVEFHCNGKYSEMKKSVIGSGIFPTLCLFNHSCNPNAEPYCYGRTQVLRASRPIPAGSEITEGYCRGFYLQPKDFRQKSLMQVFQFQCTCEACEANWPTYVELPETLQFKCIECSEAVSDLAPMCMKCFFDYERNDYEPEKQNLVDEWWTTVRRVRRAFISSQAVATKMMSGELAMENDLQSICEAIYLLEKNVAFPCQPLWDAHDALDLYFHQKRGKQYSDALLV